MGLGSQHVTPMCVIARPVGLQTSHPWHCVTYRVSTKLCFVGACACTREEEDATAHPPNSQAPAHTRTPTGTHVCAHTQAKHRPGPGAFHLSLTGPSPALSLGEPPTNSALTLGGCQLLAPTRGAARLTGPDRQRGWRQQRSSPCPRGQRRPGWGLRHVLTPDGRARVSPDLIRVINVPFEAGENAQSCGTGGADHRVGAGAGVSVPVESTSQRIRHGDRDGHKAKEADGEMRTGEFGDRREGQTDGEQQTPGHRCHLLLPSPTHS